MLLCNFHVRGTTRQRHHGAIKVMIRIRQGVKKEAALSWVSPAFNVSMWCQHQKLLKKKDEKYSKLKR